MTAARTGARRERVRAATVTEIKQTALALMHEHGITNVRFTDIARAMGMTPPALYRYFADRDELLTALITDGYDEMGRAVAEAQAGLPADALPARWLASAQAYRQWARAEPQQFALIFGLPVPGYAAPDEGPTTEAARRAMSQLSALFAEAHQRGLLGPPLVREVAPAVAAYAQHKGGTEIPPETFQAMMHAWASLQGFVTLEAYGHLEWMDAAARDALFLSQVRLAAECAGLPVPD